MHPNPSFRDIPKQTNLDLVRARGFGMLSINGTEVPLCAHIPFWLSDDGTRIEAHLARSNPILRELKDREKPALLAVNGPDAYISPDWYGVKDQVPTWNYVAVNLIGRLRSLPPKNLLPHLKRLSDNFETRLSPKPVWLTDKVDPQVLSRMMRMIVPIEMNVTSVDATWKLAQNKGEAARLAAANGLRASDPSHQTLAELMANPPT